MSIKSKEKCHGCLNVVTGLFQNWYMQPNRPRQMSPLNFMPILQSVGTKKWLTWTPHYVWRAYHTEGASRNCNWLEWTQKVMLDDARLLSLCWLLIAFFSVFTFVSLFFHHPRLKAWWCGLQNLRKARQLPVLKPRGVVLLSLSSSLSALSST